MQITFSPSLNAAACDQRKSRSEPEGLFVASVVSVTVSVGRAGHVGPMLFVIYLVWADLAHGLLVVVRNATSHHDVFKIFTDVPWIPVLPLVIGEPRAAYASPPTAERIG